MTTQTIEEMTPETLKALAARLRVLAVTLDESDQHGRAVNTLEDAQSADLHADKWASALEQLEAARRRLRRLVLNHDPDWPTTPEERDRAWADAVASLPPAPEVKP